MSITSLVEQRRLEQADGPVSMEQLKSSVRWLLLLRRFGLLEDDEALVLISGYVRAYEEVRDGRDRNEGGRSRY